MGENKTARNLLTHLAACHAGRLNDNKWNNLFKLRANPSQLAITTKQQRRLLLLGRLAQFLIFHDELYMRMHTAINRAHGDVK
jgi:hypothetical protein